MSWKASDRLERLADLCSERMIRADGPSRLNERFLGIGERARHLSDVTADSRLILKRVLDDVGVCGANLVERSTTASIYNRSPRSPST